MATGNNPPIKIYNTAILIDGAFFVKQYRAINRKNDPNFDIYNVSAISDYLHKKLVNGHLKHSNGMLYRIYYYDCEPLDKIVYNPISKKQIKLSDTPQAVFMRKLLAELRRSRKVALRLGKLVDYGFTVKPKSMKKIKAQTIELTEDDIELDIRQKQVDMKMGMDASSLAYKKLVDQIIMVTGDSDFVPVAKTARREGIDFILDPMFKEIKPELSEHIDGLYSVRIN